MLILGIESSGLAASAAYVEDGLLKAEFTLNNKMNHSVSLLPMLDQMTKISGIPAASADAIAVSAGPGSFTGLRIGAATAKGLAMALRKPIVRVSSLKALAYPAAFAPGRLACPIMDARRGQVYCAAYLGEQEIVPEGAMDIGLFLEELKAVVRDPAHGIRECLFLGDGVPVHEARIRADGELPSAFELPAFSRQRAASVALIGGHILSDWLAGNGMSLEVLAASDGEPLEAYDHCVMYADDFSPDYLRKPQAEREKEAGLLEDAGQHSLKKMSRG